MRTLLVLLPVLQAEDPRTGDVFVSSVRTGEVWRLTSGGWESWAHPAPEGSGAFALGLDVRHRLLHASVGALPRARGTGSRTRAGRHW